MSVLHTCILLAISTTPSLGARLLPRPSPPEPALITPSDSYIIGGEEVPIEDYNYVCSLQMRSTFAHNCGCTLIADNAIITAAHCVGLGSPAYVIQYGSANRLGGGTRIFLNGIYRHPDFIQDGSQGFPNDIAVVRTSGIQEGPTVGFIRMADPEEGNFAGQRCQIAGWGLRQSGGGGNLPNMLHAATTTVFAPATCTGRWPQARGDIHVCIGGVGNEASCNGDSGGPLTCAAAGGGNVLVGITSWGAAGCLTEWPSVYVRISHFKEWVIEQIPDLAHRS